MAKNKKRTKPRTENLNRQAISGLDARLLQMKRLRLKPKLGPTLSLHCMTGNWLATVVSSITQWNRQLSQAVDAYQAMLTMEEATTVDALKLEEVDQLACICPPCFGPGIKSLPNEQLEIMRQSLDSNPTQADSGEMVDPCTDQHTAANDIRGKKDWKGNDDTGLAGMTCCHDQILRFINIVQGGEKGLRGLNEGWGLSDGEGLERIWSLLAVLVGILRYSTKQHRLTALNFLAMHINEKGRAHSVKFILARLTKATRQLEETKFELRRLAQKRGWNLLYFQHQWARKRNAQLEVISKKHKKYLDELAELLDLEERLVDAEHRRKKRKFLATPLSLVHLEEAIARLTQKIGSPEFCGLDRPGDAKAQGLVKILLAKTKVYEAKVGVIEHRRRSGEKRGANIQQYLIRLRTAKNAELRKKLATYLRHAEQYNNQFHPDPSIPNPTLQELEQMEFGDPFLDCGSLTHPQEAWAVDSDTQEGVQLYLTNARCKEELRRLTKEARQMVHWAIQYQGRLDTLAKKIHEQKLASWATSIDMMKALHHALLYQATKLWRYWNPQIQSLLSLTGRPEGYEQSPVADQLLFSKWQELMSGSIASWEEYVGQALVAVDEYLDGPVDDGELELDLPDIDEEVAHPEDAFEKVSDSSSVVN
ncbi:hypothetical protein DFH28DRAFT_927475 [Melampsora americana]|nr:hypothetical protein DFH28DRAFT_927475 [Melampsora americana]